MTYPAAVELAPHDPPMLFVDELTEWNSDSLVARYRVSADNPLLVPGRGVPGYVAFEVMAQSISVHDGMTRRQSGEPPQIGFLLGARKFTTTRDWLQIGEILVIRVDAVLNEGELRAFDCRVESESGEEIAQAELKVFRPEDPEAFLASGGRR